jgi:hypothetical protein
VNANTLTLIGLTITFLMSAGGLIWNIIDRQQTRPSQVRGADAVTMKTMLDTSNEAITQSSANMREILRVNRENATLTKRQADVEFRLSALEMDNADLVDWTKRLCEQVVSLGGIPVARRKRESQ